MHSKLNANQDLWYAEITKMRPEFAARDRQRNAIADPDSYFATIDDHTRCMILQMLPDLRKSHTLSSSESLENFIAKYRKAEHDMPKDHYEDTMLDAKLILRDFGHNVRGKLVDIKLIDGLLIFNVHRDWFTRYYLTSNFNRRALLEWGIDPSTDVRCVDAEFNDKGLDQHNLYLSFTITGWYRAIPIYILPCGLILMNREDVHGSHAFLLDPATSARSEFFHHKWGHWHSEIMNDFGKITRLSQKERDVANWSKISPKMLRFWCM